MTDVSFVLDLLELIACKIAEFKSFLMYSVLHKRGFTPFWDVPARIIEAIDNLSQATIAILTFKFVKVTRRSNFHVFVNQYTIVEMEGRSIASFIWVGSFAEPVFEHFCELRNTLPKALWFNEVIYNIFELTHCNMLGHYKTIHRKILC